MYAVQIPRVIINWYEETVAPRIRLGIDSDWYMGTTVDKAPMPRPAVKRPMANCTQTFLLVISMITPTIYQNADPEMVKRRPKVSARGADPRQPIRVPTLFPISCVLGRVLLFVHTQEGRRSFPVGQRRTLRYRRTCR